MENLHLKNLKPKPNPLIILKQLNDIEDTNKNNPPTNMIIQINKYLNSLEFQNKEIEKFCYEFFKHLLYNRIDSNYNIPIQIITLLHKYKLNKLDIGTNININELNKFIENNNNCMFICNNTIIYTYGYIFCKREQLTININNNTNEVTKINYHIW